MISIAKTVHCNLNFCNISIGFWEITFFFQKKHAVFGGENGSGDNGRTVGNNWTGLFLATFMNPNATKSYLMSDFASRPTAVTQPKECVGPYCRKMKSGTGSYSLFTLCRILCRIRCRMEKSVLFRFIHYNSRSLLAYSSLFYDQNCGI